MTRKCVGGELFGVDGVVDSVPVTEGERERELTDSDIEEDEGEAIARLGGNTG